MIQPWSLKTFASQLKYDNRNNLLHKIVLDNSKETPTFSRKSIRSMLQAYCPASANAKNRHGFNALHLAVIKQNAFMVETLLSCLPTLDVNAKCQNVRGGTSLHLLVFNNICVEQTDKNYLDYQPSHGFDLREDKVKIAKLLLARGASLTARDQFGQTPFEGALETQSVDILKLFMKRGVMQTKDVCQAGVFLQAVNDGCLQRVRRFVLGGFPLDRRDVCGFTGLHFSVLLSRVRLVEYFVHEGSNINARADCGSTPLHMLLEHHGRHFRSPVLQRIATVLVNNGARLNFRDIGGRTPLVLAARENLPNHIKLFLENGANLNDCDDHGRSSLHVAVRENSWEAVKVLVESGALIDGRDSFGQTPLQYAAQGGLINMVLFLIDQNADVNSVDNAGMTPLHKAAISGCLATVEALVAHGAVVKARNIDGMTPLEMAKQHEEIEIVEFMNSLLEDKKSRNTRLDVEGPPAKRARFSV